MDQRNKVARSLCPASRAMEADWCAESKTQRSINRLAQKLAVYTYSSGAV